MEQRTIKTTTIVALLASPFPRLIHENKATKRAQTEPDKEIALEEDSEWSSISLEPVV
jgi:hypothetical protein